MADAKRDEDRGLASAQLEAFHQTFNFCMDCRQYTCTDCWNQAEGRCLSCAPMPGQLEAEVAAAHVAAQPTEATNGIQPGMAWPTIDLTADEPATATGPSEPSTEVAAATPYIPTDLRPVELPDDEIEMIVGAADAAAVIDATHDAAPESDTVEAVATTETDRPGPTFLEAVAAAAAAAHHEPDADQPAAAVAEPEQPEPIVAAEAVVVGEPEAEPILAAEMEPDIEPEPEPVAAAEPEPVAAAETEPVAAAEPEPVAEPVPVEPLTRTPTPGWAIVAPDVPRTDAPPAPPAWPPRSPVYQPPPAGPAAPAPTPSQPGQPSWPTVPPAAFSVPVAQAVWEESSLSVLSRPGSGVQACVSCGLPLSATARFCRRCGSRQG